MQKATAQAIDRMNLVLTMFLESVEVMFLLSADLTQYVKLTKTAMPFIRHHL
jgi:hypothetical protein